MNQRTFAAILLSTFLSAQLPTLAWAAPPTSEEKASSSNNLKQGLELRKKGDFAGAFQKFKDAHAFAATAVTTYELGVAHLDLGQIVEARARFAEVVGMKVADTETIVSTTARTNAATKLKELEPRIPLVVLEIEGAQASAVSATLDGAEIKSSTLGLERAVNPGKHVFAARVGDGPEASIHFEIKESEKRKVTLKVTAKSEPAKTEPAKTEPAKTEPAKTESPKAESPKTESPSAVPAKSESTATPDTGGGSSLKTIGLVAGIGGVVIAGVGTIVFLGGKSKYSDAQAQCGATGCPPSALDDADAANGQQKVGGALLIVGAVVAVGGAVLWLTAPTEKKSGVGVAVSPTGFVLRGTF